MAKKDIDMEAVKELFNWIFGANEQSYRHFMVVVKNYNRKVYKGTYEHTLAIKGMKYPVETAIETYHESHGKFPINKDTKIELAKQLVQEYEKEHIPRTHDLLGKDRLKVDEIRVGDIILQDKSYTIVTKGSNIGISTLYKNLPARFKIIAKVTGIDERGYLAPKPIKVLELSRINPAPEESGLRKNYVAFWNEKTKFLTK